VVVAVARQVQALLVDHERVRLEHELLLVLGNRAVDDAQAFLAQQRGHDVIDVLDAIAVDVGRLVHVEDLPLEVARVVVALAQRDFEFLEDVVEVLLEAGAGEEVEHAARQEERDHLRGAERDRLAACGRVHAPDLALAVEGFLEGLAGVRQGAQVADRRAHADPEAFSDFVDGHAP